MADPARLTNRRLRRPAVLAAALLLCAGCGGAGGPGGADSSGAGVDLTFRAGAGGRRLRGRSIDFERVIETAKRKVFPALVYVKPIRETHSTGEKRMQEVFGSGVIITASGLVVTNNHVVEDAVRIRCVLFDKEQIPAEIVGRDPETDLALLRLLPEEKGRRFSRAEFGDSAEITEGQFVMALGSPYGFTRSISLGIISNTRRYISFSSPRFKNRYRYNLWLQTDAAINPGNSGGPLVDMHGRVIGINTLMIFMANDLGFAIPSNAVREIVKQLERDGEIHRAWTGIEVQALKDFERDTFFDAEAGVLVANVEKDSPAKRAGLQQQDLLLRIGGDEVNGTYVVDLPAVRRRLAGLEPKKPVGFTVRRGAKTLELQVVPELKGCGEGEDYECKRWNLTVKSISKFQHPKLAYFRFPGIFIQGVRQPVGNALNAGLSRGDVIVSIDNEKVRTLEDIDRIYKKILAAEKKEKTVLFKILRGRYREWLVLNYEVDYEKMQE